MKLRMPSTRVRLPSHRRVKFVAGRLPATAPPSRNGSRLGSYEAQADLLAPTPRGYARAGRIRHIRVTPWQAYFWTKRIGVTGIV
jgi:hypothetical protein